MADGTKQKQVVFEGSATTYPVGAHVQCSFSVKSSLTPDKNDWIGLFKVGWSSVKDVVYYMYIPYPLTQSADNGCYKGTLLFQASSLPKDDGEYYHFVYFDSKGFMKGASSPFNFRIPRCDDLIEEDMSEDTEMLLITTKQMHLEVSNQELLKKLEEITRERDHLESNYIQTNDAIVEKDMRIMQLKQEIQEISNELEGLKRENTSKEAELHNLKLSFDVEKDSLQQNLEDKQAQLKECNDHLCNLRNQLDKQRGDALGIIQEKEKYVTQIAETRLSIDQYKNQVDTLSQKIQIYEALEKEHQQKMSELDTLKTMLDAGEARHKTASQEIDSLNATLSNLNQTVERLSMENDSLKSSYSSCELALRTESVEKGSLIESFTKEKNNMLSSIGSLQVQLKQLEEQRNEAMSLDEDRYFALQTAYSLVRDELTKTRSELDSLKAKRETLKKLLPADVNAQDKIYELEEKLKLSEMEWKKMAAEKNSLAQKLEARISPNTGDLSKSELQTMVEQLGSELQTMSRKKQAYKLKYQEEKQRAVAMKDHFNSEIIKREQQLQLAKSAIEEKITSPSRANAKVTNSDEVCRPRVPQFFYPGTDPKPLMLEPIVYPGNKPSAQAAGAFGNLVPSPKKDSPKALDETRGLSDRSRETVSDGDISQEVNIEEDNDVERYHDAVEAPLVDGPPESCFICHKTFTPDAAMLSRHEHISQHLDSCRSSLHSDYYTCPVCGCFFMKKDFTEEYVEGHINQHFN